VREKRASLFWGPGTGYNKGNFGYLKKSSHESLARINSLIFGLEYSWDQEIQVCTKTVLDSHWHDFILNRHEE